MSEKIQVCEGWWRQRCGRKVWVDRSTGTLYPWYSITPAGELGPWRIHYTDDGCQTSGKTTPHDLVEFLGKNITITSADIDIPELRVPILFWVCPDCSESVVTWHRGVATCDGCGRKSAE